MFGNLQAKGFNLEDTHLTNRQLIDGGHPTSRTGVMCESALKSYSTFLFCKSGINACKTYSRRGCDVTARAVVARHDSEIWVFKLVAAG